MITNRPNVDDPGRIVAHRGASIAAPENTLAAIKVAARQGARWLECDVMLLGDGTPVIHHDAVLDRCTTGRGPLSALAAPDLVALSAGIGHGATFANEPVPTLNDVLDLVSDLDFHANVEIKRHDRSLGATATVLRDALVARPWTRHRIIVSSFDHDELQVLRTLMPDQPIAGLWHDPPSDWRARLDKIQAAALHLNFRNLRQSLLAEAQSFGFDVRVYTINEPRLMVPFRGQGLTGVITDDPERFLDDPDWAAWSES